MDRTLLFKDLVEFNKPIVYFKEKLDNLSFWDQEPIVKIKLENIKNIVNKFIKKQLPEEDLIEWFGLIETKDELQYGDTETEHEIITDIIEKLANFHINFDSDDKLKKYLDFIMNSEKAVDTERALDGK